MPGRSPIEGLSSTIATTPVINLQLIFQTTCCYSIMPGYLKTFLTLTQARDTVTQRFPELDFSILRETNQLRFFSKLLSFTHLRLREQIWPDEKSERKFAKVTLLKWKGRIYISFLETKIRRRYLLSSLQPAWRATTDCDTTRL